MGNAYAQQHYLSANYTHVARELLAHGVNVVAQMIASRVSDGRTEYSLSCNPDVSLDLLPELDAARRGGREIVTIGVVNRHLRHVRRCPDRGERSRFRRRTFAL